MVLDWDVGLETKPENRSQGIHGTMDGKWQLCHKPWLKFHKSILSPKTSVSILLICSLLRFLMSVNSPGNAFSRWNSKCWSLWFPRAQGTSAAPLRVWEQGGVLCFVQLSLDLFQKRGKRRKVLSGSFSGVGFGDAKPRMTAEQEKKKSLDILH